MKTIEERELRRVAIHEAAHLIICETLGGCASATVWRNESSDPNDKAYLGQCHIYHPPSGEDADFYVGLAGIAAEEMEDEGDDEYALTTLWERLEFNDNISNSDAEMIGDHEQITHANLEKMIAMIRQEWEAVNECAERLITSVEVAA
jgi:hypothetical protein